MVHGFKLRKRKREVLSEDEDLSEDEATKAKSAFDGELLPGDWELPEDKTGAFDRIFMIQSNNPSPSIK